MVSIYPFAPKANPNPKCGLRNSVPRVHLPEACDFSNSVQQQRNLSHDHYGRSDTGNLCQGNHSKGVQPAAEWKPERGSLAPGPSIYSLQFIKTKGGG